MNCTNKTATAIDFRGTEYHRLVDPAQLPHSMFCALHETRQPVLELPKTISHKPNKPSYNPRSFNGTRSPRMIEVKEKIPPAPRPWTVLPAISIAIDFDAPHMVLPTAKRAIALSAPHLRPKSCAMPLVMGRIATMARAYDAPAQIKSAPFRECTMVGRAVDTAVRSRAVGESERQSESIIRPMRLGRVSSSCGGPEAATAVTTFLSFLLLKAVFIFVSFESYRELHPHDLGNYCTLFR